MKIWPTVRDELRGAWRSMRYDLTRRPMTGTGPASPSPTPGLVGADYDPYEGGPRRVLVSAGVAALIVGGAVGSYFGVANGLGSLLERPPAPGALPAVAGDSDVTALGTAEPAEGRRTREDRPAGAGAETPAGPTPSTSIGRAVGRATVVPQPPATEAIPAEPAEPGAPVPTPAPSWPCDDDPAPTPSWPCDDDPTPMPDASEPTDDAAEPDPFDPSGPADWPTDVDEEPNGWDRFEARDRERSNHRRGSWGSGWDLDHDRHTGHGW